MQFRDHPALYEGISHWPPTWITTRQDETDIPVGEVGELMSVIVIDTSENTIFLRIKYHDKSYMGCLFLGERQFSRHLALVLKGLIGRSIKEVGDFDLSFTL